MIFIQIRTVHTATYPQVLRPRNKASREKNLHNKKNECHEINRFRDNTATIRFDPKPQQNPIASNEISLYLLFLIRRWQPSFARVFFDPFAALVARDAATPVKLAVALRNPRVLVSVVAPSAAQQIASVRPCRTTH